MANLIVSVQDPTPAECRLIAESLAVRYRQEPNPYIKGDIRRLVVVYATAGLAMSAGDGVVDNGTAEWFMEVTRA